MKVDPSQGAESLRPQIRPKRGAKATPSSDKSLTARALDSKCLSRLQKPRLPSLWGVSHSGRTQALPPSPPSLHPPASAMMEPARSSVCPLCSLNSSFNSHFYHLGGNGTDRVSCLQGIPKALRYKPPGIEWLGRYWGRFLSAYPPTTITPSRRAPSGCTVCWWAGCGVISVRGGGGLWISRVWLMKYPFP